MKSHTSSLPGVALFSGAFFGFALPIDLLVRNRDFIDASSGHIVGLAAIASLALAVLLGSTVLMAPRRARPVLLSLLAALATIAFLHNMLPLGTSGLLDGSDLQFSFSGPIYALSVAISVLVPILFVARHATLHAPLQWVALWMTIFLVGQALWQLHGSEHRPPPPDAPSFEEVANFSTDRNVLMVLMDSLQSDVLREVIASDAELRERLRGFVLYADALGAAATTYMTMPAMLAGEGYDGRSPLREFFTDRILEGTFLTDLADAGWEVAHVNPMIDCERGVQICARESMMLRSEWSVAAREYARLFDLGLLNASPYPLRPAVYADGSWQISRWFERDDRPYLQQSVTFLERFAGAINASDGPPRLKLIHLMNTHPPFGLAPDCERRLVRRGREAYRDQVRCGLRLFAAVLDQLRAHGIEERTAVFLLADTGVTVGWRQAHADAQAAGVEEEMAELIGSASPAIMVKRARAGGSFSVSDAPVQIADVPQTVCDLTGSCSRQYGVSLFDVEPSSPRVRRFVDYEWATGSWHKQRLPRVDIWEVNGPAHVAESWQLVEHIVYSDELDGATGLDPVGSN